MADTSVRVFLNACGLYLKSTLAYNGFFRIKLGYMIFIGLLILTLMYLYMTNVGIHHMTYADVCHIEYILIHRKP